MSVMSDSRRLTIMMHAGDVARADMALTPERIYYRFATDESIEDGELPPAKEDFNLLSDRLVAALTANDGEQDLADDMSVKIFINNRLSDIRISEASMRRLVAELRSVAEEFAFLGGFCR